jgi:hypothetical protein
VEAQAALGEFYLNEFDPAWELRSNLTESIRYSKLAAEAGDPRGQDDLGERFRDGRGVGQNYTKAVEMFTFAAKQGDADAYLNLAELYEAGPESYKNLGESLYWYLRYEDWARPLRSDSQYAQHRRAALSRLLSPSKVVAEVKRSQQIRPDQTELRTKH